MSRNFWSHLYTLANLITAGRLCATPLVVYLLLHSPEFPSYKRLALLLVLILQVSDILDGFLARCAKRMTSLNNPLGEILDPLADKIYIGSTYIAMSIALDFHIWLTVLIISRDALIAAGWVGRYLRTNTRLRPNVVGKIADSCQALLIFAILLEPPVLFLNIGILLTTLFTIVSGLVYAREALASHAGFPGKSKG